MSLNQAIFTLKTVTPLFLSGADGEIPELRAPSFRGALRFWLRALLGATIGNDRDNLYKRESEVFGNTSSASPLVVRVSELASLNTKAHRVLPHSNQKTFSLPSYDAGQSFNLTLTNRSGQARLPDEAIAALLMLLSFGGVGKRARRGFGSLGLIQSVYQEPAVPENDHNPLKTQPANGQQLAVHLKQVLKTAQHLVSQTQNNSTDHLTIPSYPLFSSSHACVLVCQKPFETYRCAMVSFWKMLRQSKFIDDIFGYARGNQRRASPLFLHIAQTTNGYHLVLTAMRAQPPDTSGNWSLVTDFLHECKNRWQGKFIFGGTGW